MQINYNGGHANGANAFKMTYACTGAGPVVLFDEIEEARPDFMTSALVNAVDHKGFVEFSRKTSDGQCVTEQARTAGGFIVLTSNCFMDDLAEVLAVERR